MSAAPTPPGPPLPALDRDLYCLTCGYNLRGLSGDPVRCPECGNLNPIGDVEIPAEIITKQLRQMETSPALCVGAIILGVPLTVLFSMAVIALAGSADTGLLFCSGLAAFVCFSAWVGGAARFRASCLGRPGWGRVLLAYQVWGLLLVGVVAAVMTLGAWLLWPLTAVSRGPYDALIFAALMFALCLAIILGVRIGLRPLHALVTRQMRVLQREVAVTLARDAIRKRLTEQRRGLFG